MITKIFVTLNSKCQDTAAENLLIYSKNITEHPAISSNGSEIAEDPNYMGIIHGIL